MSTVRAARSRFAGVSWVRLSLVAGGFLTIGWSAWQTRGLDARLVRDGVVFFVIPLALALTFGKDLGFRVDRRAVMHAVVLAAFVLPFYVVGSSLPSIRAYYPMWGLDSTAPGVFLPHAAKQFLVVVAAETYYRGLLCVGIREIGPKSILISPIVYALAHAAKPPVELILSGPTDVLFGAMDYRSASLLPSIVAHGLGLVLLDWLVLRPPLLAPARVVGWFAWVPIPV